VSSISFHLCCLPNTYNTHEPEGYLFACPPEDFWTGQNVFQCPDYPAYWSLDPSGATPLSPEDAKILGFPIIHIETFIDGKSWDKSVYDGLRRFHWGKGLNPESQEVAIDLGFPLYNLSSEMVGPLAGGEPEGNTRIFWLTYFKGKREGLWCNRKDPARCWALGHYL
jgi:hypothetical protein